MPLPNIQLQTCLFGYPLKQGCYAFMGAEAVFMILGVLGTIAQGQIDLKLFITLIMAACMVIATGIGLYGVKEEKLTYITAYVAIQTFYVFLVILGILGSLFTLALLSVVAGILFFVFMGYTLVVAYSYLLQLRQNAASNVP